MKINRALLLLTLMTLISGTLPIKANANEIKISETKITIHTGEVLRLKVKGTGKKIKWSSRDEKVATVDEAGKVRGAGKGVTKVVAKVGGDVFKCRITVRKKGLNYTGNTVEEGGEFKLELNGIGEEAEWESANPEIAEVAEDGTVTGIKPGVVRVLARTSRRVYSCRVVVASYKDVVYLTFDDGPSADITPKVLDILKKKNVKATFFVLNYSPQNEKLIKRIVKEGHTLAIHGYSHVYRDIYRSEEAFMENVTRLRKKLKKSTGEDCTIIRFPGGSSNTSSRFNPGVMTRLTKRVLEEGYYYFDWNVSSGDAGRYKTKKTVYKNVTRGIKKNRENIVLLHDFNGNYPTLHALEDIIDYAKYKGYVFKCITEDTKQIHQTVAN